MSRQLARGCYPLPAALTIGDVQRILASSIFVTESVRMSITREPVARARTTDPDTSHEAAQSVNGTIARNQGYVLQTFRENVFPMTDHALFESYAALERPGIVGRQSESGIRTRRKELVDRGVLEDSGVRVRLPSGRHAIRWQLVEQPQPLR